MTDHNKTTEFAMRLFTQQNVSHPTWQLVYLFYLFFNDKINKIHL